MSLEVKIHEAQTLILRELLFLPTAGFAQLQKSTGLDSDHFNFHIKRLVELDLAEKVGRGEYRLSRKGKEYANKLDTEHSTIERQPKISVILVIWRDENRRELLLQERLKNPYFGYWGYPTGKVSWGERIVETAQRELLEDKIFLITETIAPTGELRDAEGCHNEWIPLDDALKFEKTFPGFGTVQEIVSGKTHLEEYQRFYGREQF